MSDTTMDENPEVTADAVEEVTEGTPQSSKYEMMAIISATLSEEQIKKELKALKALLGDDVVYEEIWGMRDFAYPIKGQTKGYYVVWNFMLDAQTVKSMEATIKLMPNIVRYLVMKVPANYKPITLKEMEAGMEALREEKAEKRGKRSTGQKRTAKKAPEKAEAKDKSDEAAPAAKEEKKAVKEEDSKKSLDEKLDDILSDADLGL